MRILPAVDLMDGHAVQLIGGDPDRRAFDEDDPVKRAHRFVDAGAGGLHVVDLDAALERGENRVTVRALIDAVDVPVQVGGGVRTTKDLDDLIAAGASTVVVGTRALKDPEWLADVADANPDRVVVALDARHGEVVVRGWREGTGRDVEDVAQHLDDLPLGGILCTAVHAEGRMQGIDGQSFLRLMEATDHPVIASGGISSTADIRALVEAGCDACVIGMAVYTGQLSLSAALRAAREEATQS